MSRWSSVRVVSTLLLDARGIADKQWVMRYFLARLAVLGQQPLRFLAPGPRSLSWRSSPAPLAASMQSGGLSSWYEIAHCRTYAPIPSFQPRSGWTVVDVGANIGAYAVWAGSTMGESGRLLAVEPNPISFERLQVSLEALQTPNAAVQAACGAADGEAVLHYESGYTVSSSLIPFAGATQSHRVRVRRLDDLLSERGIDHVDLLKIDVEGAEDMVLQGAGRFLLTTDRVILETSAGANDAAVRRTMHAGGFALTHEAFEHWGIPGLTLLAFEQTSRVAA